MSHLVSEGHGASRINTQGQWDEENQCWRYSGSTEGASDVIACLWPGGRFCAVEVKRGTDTLRPGQVTWLADQASAGAVTFVADGFSSFLEFYNDLIKTGVCKKRELR